MYVIGMYHYSTLVVLILTKHAVTPEGNIER